MLLALLPLVGPGVTTAQPGTAQFLHVLLDSVTPEIVTTTSEPLVTVTGRIRNVGDRAVRDVVVRLEHAPAVASSSALRTDLTGKVDQYQPVADFITAAPEIVRGQEVPFRLAYPLRSAERPSLNIERPGVYPLMVNVNGTPDYGAPARLDDARFLLPILGVPPDDASPADENDVLNSAVPPDTTRPSAVRTRTRGGERGQTNERGRAPRTRQAWEGGGGNR